MYALLDVTDVDGLFSQIGIGGRISISVIREFEALLWKTGNAGIDLVSDLFIKAGEYIRVISSFLGQPFIVARKPIDERVDVIGNMAGSAIQREMDTQESD